MNVSLIRLQTKSTLRNIRKQKTKAMKSIPLLTSDFIQAAPNTGQTTHVLLAQTSVWLKEYWASDRQHSDYLVTNGSVTPKFVY